ncbi:SDR family oxidoreductase, partial [Siminovitchia sp. 179-K 8D1 HS]|uniref:SDR family oxidoreductase n=1 Tax=Siminovitchia sp. 179-K 8D1 HS TaxID=3142385 RepID=UPI0039A18B52
KKGNKDKWIRSKRYWKTLYELKEICRTGVRVTNISPGMVDTSLSGSRSDRKKLEAEDIAKAVLYAVTQPVYVNVNEITIRPV